VAAREGVGADLWFVSAGPIGCLATGERPRVEGCVGAEVGKLGGQGTGLPIIESGSAWWGAASLSGALLWPLVGALSGKLEAEADLPLIRPRFVLGGIGEIHRASAVTARGTIGLEWRF
jgi:hypothetical protein